MLAPASNTAMAEDVSRVESRQSLTTPEANDGPPSVVSMRRVLLVAPVTTAA